MGRLFGTDGVRGVYGKDLTNELAYMLGKAGCLALKKGEGKPLIVIGMDTRISGPNLEEELARGIKDIGGDVIRLGVIPTPAVALLTREYKADCGIVISASHNPYEYNGIKFFNSEGFKLDDSVEERIEDLILNDVKIEDASVKGEEVTPKLNPREIYLNHLVETKGDLDLSGKKVVLDCANGASSGLAKELYERLGAEVMTLSDTPNGENINLNCGSTHPENLAIKVKEVGADFGLAFDGDADRLIVVDDLGRVVDGDKTIAISAIELKKENALNENLVTVTVMSNIGFHKAMKDNDIKVEVTKVGDRYVLESMLKTGSVIGGEQSGHIIFLSHTTTGDGMLSSIQFVRAVMNSGKKLSELSDEITIYPQVLINAKVKNEYKKTYMEDEDVKTAISEVEKALEGNGRVLIRPSGTEPLVRVMLEGDDTEVIRPMAERIANVIESKFA